MFSENPVSLTDLHQDNIMSEKDPTCKTTPSNRTSADKNSQAWEPEFSQSRVFKSSTKGKIKITMRTNMRRGRITKIRSNLVSF